MAAHGRLRPEAPVARALLPRDGSLPRAGSHLGLNLMGLSLMGLNFGPELWA
jgi:hypothetical protein